MKMKWIKAVRLVAALALLSLGSAQLVASRTTQYERYYYTDSTMTEECGYGLVFCDGATYTGCFNSPYYRTFDLPSCTNPGDNPNPNEGGPMNYPENSNCADGFDNDHDNLTDLDDPDCW